MGPLAREVAAGAGDVNMSRKQRGGGTLAEKVQQ